MANQEATNNRKTHTRKHRLYVIQSLEEAVCKKIQFKVFPCCRIPTYKPCGPYICQPKPAGNRRGSLNWKQRFDIIVGVARGLAYLHEEFHVCIIHRDIKPSNILLDDNFQPRIADFGLARLLPEDQSHLSTKFAGTLGYTAPEYAIHGQLSEKVDTYSYGVVVLEIISGRKSNDTKLEPVAQYLLEWAWKLYETDSLMKLVDESLDPNEYREEEAKRAIEIALMCTQSVVASRPTMSEVVVMLRSKGEHGLNPTHPTFIDASSRVQVQVDTSTSTVSSTSNATMSISQYSAR